MSRRAQDKLRLTGTSSSSSPDYLLVLDLEATSNENGPPIPQFIIEFPTLLLNMQTGKVESEFHYYIRPDVQPILSKFCTEVTGIDQSTINEKGVPLATALNRHKEWLREHGLRPLTSNGQFAQFTDHRDETTGTKEISLRATCLPRQLQGHHHIGSSDLPLGFQQWLNIKDEFRAQYGVKAKGMVFMLERLGLELEGRVDCRNIARVCNRMLRDGWTPSLASAVSAKVPA